MALKDRVAEGVLNQMSGIFDRINNRVDWASEKIGTSPADFNSSIYNMIENISDSVILPIAGIILTFIACAELIQMVIDQNNLANLDTWIFFKWVFKIFIAVLLLANTFDICMAVFDLAEYVIDQSAGIINGELSWDDSVLESMEESLEEYGLFALIAIFLETFLLRMALNIMSVFIFIIVYGRLITIYLTIAIAPIPFATFANREQSQIGQNYLRTLLALAFQGFLMMICIAIYAALVQNVTLDEDVMISIWTVVGYTALLCFSLMSTNRLSKSIFNAH